MRNGRVVAARRTTGISVNDFLPDYDELASRLAAAQVESWSRFSEQVHHPPPRYSVIVAGRDVGMTLIRRLCPVIAAEGEWYLQIWEDDALSKLREWIAQRGIALDADYPRTDD